MTNETPATIRPWQDEETITTLRARLAEVERERDAYKRRLELQGVCMSCVIVPPDTFGCSDCLNTGYEHGEPLALIAEREKSRRRLVERVREWIGATVTDIDAQKPAPTDYADGVQDGRN